MFAIVVVSDLVYDMKRIVLFYFLSRPYTYMVYCAAVKSFKHVCFWKLGVPVFVRPVTPVLWLHAAAGHSVKLLLFDNLIITWIEFDVFVFSKSLSVICQTRAAGIVHHLYLILYKKNLRCTITFIHFYVYDVFYVLNVENTVCSWLFFKSVLHVLLLITRFVMGLSVKNYAQYLNTFYTFVPGYVCYWFSAAVYNLSISFLQSIVDVFKSRALYCRFSTWLFPL